MQLVLSAVSKPSDLSPRLCHFAFQFLTQAPFVCRILFHIYLDLRFAWCVEK